MDALTKWRASASTERFKQAHITANVPTPLAIYLHIYNQAHYDSYIDYMKGAKALAKYLAPIEINLSIYAISIPEILVSYELIELAKVLLPHTTKPYIINTIQIENAIYEQLT